MLFQFASHDKHTFCTANGSHKSDGLKLSAVLDNRNTKNLHRIEDGIYPERVLPTMTLLRCSTRRCQNHIS